MNREKRLAEVRETSRVNNEKLLAKVQEISKENNEKLLAVVKETSRVNSDRHLVDVQETFRVNNEKLLTDNEKLRAEVKEENKKMEMKLQETFRVNNEKLLAQVQEISKVNSEKLSAAVKETSRVNGDGHLVEVRETSGVNEKLRAEVKADVNETIQHLAEMEANQQALQEPPLKRASTEGEYLVWAREEEEDCIEIGLLVLEPADVKSGHVKIEALVEQCNDGMVPVGVLGLSRSEKIIRTASEMGECASAEAVNSCEKVAANEFSKEIHELVRRRIKMITDQVRPDVAHNVVKVYLPNYRVIGRDYIGWLRGWMTWYIEYGNVEDR